jgi:hypothetical protein
MQDNPIYDEGTNEMAQWIAKNKTLQELDLSYTKMTEKGTRTIIEAAAISGLNKLNLGDSTPSEFLDLDMNGIRKFLSSVAVSSSKSKQQKLLILGKERYGKTSLLHFLQLNKPIGPSTESTDGIDISHWKPIKTTEKKKQQVNEEEEIEFSCWDFAGQRVCLVCFGFLIAF